MTDAEPPETQEQIKKRHGFGNNTRRSNGAEGQTGELRQFRVISFADVNAPADSADFVEGLLIEGQLSVLRGAPGTGKTFLAADLGMHVALGRPWFGREVERRAVVYIAGEGALGIEKRVFAFKQRHGSADKSAPFFIIPEAAVLGPAGPDLPRLLATLLALNTGGAKLGLVVVDTLSRALAGADENSPEGMGAYVANVDQIRLTTGAHVMTVHHTGKDESRGGRGHNSLLGAIDTEIAITRDNVKKVSNVTITKQRDLEGGQTFGFKLGVEVFGSDRRGKAMASCVVEPVVGTAKDASGSTKKSNANHELALKYFDEVLAKDGEPAPVDDHFPAGATVVPVDTFRDHIYRSGVIRNEGAAKRQAWGRLLKTLTAAGYIGEWDGMLWRCSGA